MNAYPCVYVLPSESDREQIYAGQTAALKQRLQSHNSGKVTHTSKFVPWSLRESRIGRRGRIAEAR
ncbi:MAG TPA: GIY-YIG nuclease family protein [Verrucomicrobiae bacterium]|nr:GIY-YIG nuclease family protein [Verrucomicrobiae bacterium]